MRFRPNSELRYWPTLRLRIGTLDVMTLPGDPRGGGQKKRTITSIEVLFDDVFDVTSPTCVCVCVV